MAATLILDNSLIIDMCDFDRFYQFRQTGKEKGYYSIRTAPSLAGLQHLGKCGTTFVLPEEVLKEMTHMLQSDDPAVHDRFREQGLSCSQEGRPYLDLEALAQVPNGFRQASFLKQLAWMQSQGFVRCYRSVEDFQAARRQKTLGGIIAIVPTAPLEPGSAGFTYGVQKTKQPREQGDQSGDDAIMAIRDRLHYRQDNSPEETRPLGLLASDGPLCKRFLPEDGKPRPNLMAMSSLRLYHEMLQKTGYGRSADIAEITPLYEEASREDFKMRVKNPRSLGKAITPESREALDAFLARAYPKHVRQAPAEPENGADAADPVPHRWTKFVGDPSALQLAKDDHPLIAKPKPGGKGA